MAIDQLLSVTYFHYKRQLTLKRLFTLLIGVQILAIIFNIHLYFLNGSEYTTNGTTYVNCYESPIFPLWEKIHFYIYSIGPFLVILFFNIHLLRIAYKVSKIKRMRLAKISLNVILQSVFFLIMTMPSSFISAYYYKDLIYTNIGKIVIYLSDNILFTFHSINLFSMMLTNKQFYNECKIIVGIKIQPETQINVITTPVIERKKRNITTSEISSACDYGVATSVI